MPKLFSTVSAWRGAAPGENSGDLRMLQVTVERMVPEELVERLSATRNIGQRHDLDFQVGYRTALTMGRAAAPWAPPASTPAAGACPRALSLALR